jgi:hypothetical protein
MMLDDTSRRGSDHSVPACDMADHAADGRSFQTAFCTADA